MCQIPPFRDVQEQLNCCLLDCWSKPDFLSSKLIWQSEIAFDQPIPADTWHKVSTKPTLTRSRRPALLIECQVGTANTVRSLPCEHRLYGEQSKHVKTNRTTLCYGNRVSSAVCCNGDSQTRSPHTAGGSAFLSDGRATSDIEPPTSTL